MKTMPNILNIVRLDKRIRKKLQLHNLNWGID